MRTPTPAEIKQWATTPIMLLRLESKDKEGNLTITHEWQRHINGNEVVEILEGLPHIKWILARKPKSLRSYQLVGVE